MAEPENLSQLARIREEVDAALMTARIALTTSSDITAIQKRLPICIEHLEQVRGALDMVQLPGAAMVLDEMLQLTRMLLEAGEEIVQTPRPAVDALVRALLQLPAYFEQLEQGAADSPYMMQPLIDELRAARGMSPLTQQGMFSPHLDVVGPGVVSVDDEAGQLRTLLERLRPVYERALSEWKNQPAEQDYAEQLALMMDALANASGTSVFRQLFEVAEAVFILLKKGELSLEKPLCQLLGRLDQQLEQLVSSGETELLNTLPEELMQDLLYQVACAQGGGEKVDAIRERYRLDQALPSSKAIAQVHARLKAQDWGALQSALSALRSEMGSIKKNLDDLFQNGVRQGEKWLAVVDGLKQFVTTLEFLGLKISAGRVRPQIEVLQQVVEGQQIADEPCLMAVAKNLLLVESVLKGGLEEAALETGSAAETLSLVDGDNSKIRSDTCNEAISELNRVKATLENAPSNLSRKEFLPALETVGGALEMLELHEAVRLNHICHRYIDSIVGNAHPQQQTQLGNVAELIVAVEFYLHALAAGRPDAEQLLEPARLVAAELGDSATLPRQSDEKEGEDDRTIASIIRASIPSTGTETELKKALVESIETAPELKDGASVEAAESVDEPLHEKVAEDVAAEQKASGVAAVEAPARLQDPSPYVPGQDPVLLDIFAGEVHGHLAAIRGFIVNAEGVEEAGEPDMGLLRILHTLHGSALTAGIEDIAELFGQLESHVEKLIEKQLPMQSGLLRLFEDCCSGIETMLDSLPQSGVDAELADKHSLLERIDVLERLLETPSEPVEELTPEQKAEAELRQVFSDECDEILGRFYGHLQQWREDKTDRALMRALERELHTLKGSARVVGVGAIADISHVLESLLVEVSAERIAPADSLFELLEKVHEQLLAMVEQLKGGCLPEDAPGLIRQIREFVVDSHGMAQQDDEDSQERDAPLFVNRESGRIVRFPPPEEEHQQTADEVSADEPPQPQLSPEQFRIRADLIDSMAGMASEAGVCNSRIVQQLEGGRQNIEELHRTVERLRDQLRRLDMETESQMLSNYAEVDDSSGEQFDPLELDRFSRKQTLSRGIMESLNDLSSLEELLSNQIKQSESLLQQQGEATLELQDVLNRARLQPFSSYLLRLHRVVEQACKALGKEVDLYVEGAEQELDRSMLARVLPAIEHILRNAVTHGIEMPPLRCEAGKPEKGKLTIQLERHGSDMLIRIHDDGTGLDLERIRHKGIDAGYLRSTTPFTEEQAVQFIQQAGFSTVDSVTQLAGRGVGLDVVNNEIRQLGGTVQVSSRQGEGVRFTLRLPLIRYLSSALLVKVGTETYALPPMGIEGITRIEGAQISASEQDRGLDSYVECMGQSYRIEILADLVGARRLHRYRNDRHAIVILLRVAEHRLAVVVDKVFGEREIVMKSFGSQLSRVKGIPGATFLDDGSAVLILDLAALIESDGSWHKGVSQHQVSREEVGCKVLMVDDSITVRSVMARFLGRQGIHVLTAKDGMEALLVLEKQRPDVILLDVEMPHMNGYELTRYIRNDADLKDIPIIMISSRSGEKHRQKALALGVEVYLSKPYQEDELLEHIRQLQAPKRVKPEN